MRARVRRLGVLYLAVAIRVERLEESSDCTLVSLEPELVHGLGELVQVDGPALVIIELPKEVDDPRHPLFKRRADLAAHILRAGDSALEHISVLPLQRGPADRVRVHLPQRQRLEARVPLHRPGEKRVLQLFKHDRAVVVRVEALLRRRQRAAGEGRSGAGERMEVRCVCACNCSAAASCNCSATL